MPTEPLREQARTYFLDLQGRILAALEAVDGHQFREDSWSRPGGGGGKTRVLVEGNVLEKAGVNFSDVHGEMPEDYARHLPGSGRQFSACGISLVLHPRNPYVPTVHANFRFLTKGDQMWFGGGADLTPYYPFREDVIHFHQIWHQVCARFHHVVNYGHVKRWCDEYFLLHHRQEPRGVGGIFFDSLGVDPRTGYPDAVRSGGVAADHPEAGPADPVEIFGFVRAAGDAFLDAYLPILKRRLDTPYGDRERRFQEFRRGRYVEFNLIHDRGTLFGLKTAGRIESILMSLPPVARWFYDYHPEPGTPEGELYEVYLKPRDWAAEPT